MKKFFLFMLSLCICLTFSVSLAACDFGFTDPEHTHTFETEWTYNETHHWHKCQDGDCDEIIDQAEHNYINGECECGAIKQVEHVCDFEGEWTYNETHHWHKCQDDDCDEIIDQAEHNYINGECECGAIEQVEHICDFEEEWTYNETHHWHKCKDDTCSEISDRVEHNYINDECECGAYIEHVCIFKAEWSYDSTYHWHKCEDSTCSEIGDKTEHNYIDGICECGRLETQGLKYTLMEDQAGYSVSVGNAKNATSIVIPKTYKGLPVKVIGENAFSGCSNLKKIVIPSSVVSIGKSAFSSCASLTEMVVPFIGNSRDATGHEAVFGYIFGYKTNSSSSSVSGHTYQYNIGSEYYHYSIPSTISIVTITDTTKINSRAFWNCSMVKELSLPAKLDEIEYSAFYDCYGLEKIYYNGDLNSWATIKFGDALANPVEFAKQLYIEGRILENATITGIEKVSQYAFENCDSLQKVLIGDGVKIIGAGAFSGCDKLEDITISKSVELIGDGALSYCKGLDNIFVDVYNEIYKSIDGNLYTADGKTLIKYAIGKDSKTFTVPNTVEVIYNNAFAYATNLESVIISDSVKEISYQAFFYCTNLSEVKFGVALESIGDSAFWACAAISTLEIPDKVKTIGNAAFTNCRGLKNVVIKNGLEHIGKEAFYACDGLSSLVIPFVGASREATGFEAVFGYIFGYKTSLNNSPINGAICQFDDGKTYYHYYIPDSLRSVSITDDDNIESKAFYKCKNIENVLIGESVEYIGDKAFYGCENLQSMTLPFVGANRESTLYESVFGYIFGYVVSAYKTETDKVYPLTYQFAYYHAESEFTNYYHYYIPNTLVSVSITDDDNICERAFYNCGYLTDIAIGDSVKEICIDAFYGCNSLENITLPFVGNTREGTETYKSVFGYPFGYKTGTITSNFEGCTEQCYKGSTYYYYYIPASLRSVKITDTQNMCAYAFKNCENLTTIELPNTMNSVGMSIFDGCKALSSIAIPNGITSLDINTFNGCTNLKTIVLPNSLSSIGGSSFDGCNNLEYTEYDNACYLGNDDNPYLVLFKTTSKNITSCATHEKTKIIYGDAFDSCTSLKSLTITAAVETIGQYVFMGCSSLVEITISKQNQIYDSRDNSNAVIETSTNKLLFGCQGTVIPSSIEIIGSRAFYYCHSLKEIKIPSSVTVIEDYAFYDCYNLSNIVFEEDSQLVSLGFAAFGRCEALTSIVIPKGVTKIGDNAFRECLNLKNVYYTGSREDWKNITIGSNNDYLKNATIEYDYTGNS